MDNYPDNLAPSFDEGGGVSTPFNEWWPTVKSKFGTVPENVAQYWLHEHWGHSPFGWLLSNSYQFNKIKLPARELWSIRSRWCDFCPENKDCFEHGKHLLRTLKYQTALDMQEAKNFPSPIVVLNNHDGHLEIEAKKAKQLCHDYPSSLILIEGHRRFNIALYLQRINGLNAEVDIWLMERITSEK